LKDDAVVADFVGTPSRSVHGFQGELESIVPLVQNRFPGKPYCLVEQWTVFRADVSQPDQKEILRRGHLPFFIYAHKVLKDSRRRFQPGDWVRSSMALTFDGVMFETKNTVYVLVGDGFETTASLKAIFSFF
jgi:hypothetical protein